MITYYIVILKCMITTPLGPSRSRLLSDRTGGEAPDATATRRDHVRSLQRKGEEKKNRGFFLEKKGPKMCHFFVKKSDAFCVKKRTSFFSSKIAKSHFFQVLESPAYISANRVGNFFYIEKRQFFHKNLIKFPTHFPDRYLACQIFQGSKLLQHFCVQKSVQMLFKKVFTCCSQKCSKNETFS
jgi:hypothetical protein